MLKNVYYACSLNRHFYIFIILANAICFPFLCFANIQIYPLRVHLTPQSLSASLTVRNKDTIKKKFLLNSVYFEQSKDGTLTEISDELKFTNSVLKTIRYSPRSFELNADAEQVVRVMARQDKRMEPGDYRGHLRFITEETAESNDSASKGNNLALNLKAKISMSIPVLYRIEPIDKKIELKNFKIDFDKKSMSIDIIRVTKNYYPYGKIVLYSMKGKVKSELLQVNGVQCFSDSLSFKYNYENIPETIKKMTEVSVDFIDTFADKEVIVATSSFKL
jgi:P pilus assembly chaperone PapD